MEYTEGLLKKDLHDPDNHGGVITHLEPDILECEVKRASDRYRIQDAWGWDSGMTQRDGIGREVGGGFRMGNTHTPMADSCQYTAKTTIIL